MVDDDEWVRSTTSRVLRLWGHHIVEAPDGPSALEVWKQYADEIDLLLTDLNMPGDINGWKLCRQLKADKGTLKAIICSGDEAALIQLGAGAVSGVHYLVKPYHLEDLAGLLRKCFE